eukprot:m.55919 g.55919  ORF g.55919 m.55919 type:complete len:73 (+) comp34519_c0_seq6:1095-1313(+)
MKSFCLFYQAAVAHKLSSTSFNEVAALSNEGLVEESKEAGESVRNKRSYWWSKTLFVAVTLMEIPDGPLKCL